MENELWEFKIFADMLNNICCIQKKKHFKVRINMTYQWIEDRET